MRILCVVGTRPEAIKMAPVILALRADPRFSCRVCSAGQHREMLRQALDCFSIKPDIELDVMTDDQTLNGLSALLISRADAMLVEEAPDRVLVHGDTTTAMITALAAFHRAIPVAHVEAGLRTRNLRLPWPEEMNRRVIDIVADTLFAPTTAARDALLAESLGGRILVTGNTVVDSLTLALKQLDADAALLEQVRGENVVIKPGRKLVLATCHRRENFGGSLERICMAVQSLGDRADTDVVLPVHRNPRVRGPIEAGLTASTHVHLVAPQSYLAFVDLLRRADVVVTDSGGVQEEAVSLGKPLVVMRDVSERIETATRGMRLVGSDPGRIVAAISTFLDGDQPGLELSVQGSPYGDGAASHRIVAALAGDATEEFRAPHQIQTPLHHRRLG